jgi:hypothetical protein
MYAEDTKGGGGGGRRLPRAPRENTINSNLCKFWSVWSFISVCMGVGFGGYEFRSRNIFSKAHVLWQFNFSGPSFTICTTCLNTLELCILLTESVIVFRMVLTINSHLFP